MCRNVLCRTHRSPSLFATCSRPLPCRAECFTVGAVRTARSPLSSGRPGRPCLRGRHGDFQGHCDEAADGSTSSAVGDGTCVDENLKILAMARRNDVEDDFTVASSSSSAFAIDDDDDDEDKDDGDDGGTHDAGANADGGGGG